MPNGAGASERFFSIFWDGCATTICCSGLKQVKAVKRALRRIRMRFFIISAIAMVAAASAGAAPKPAASPPPAPVLKGAPQAVVAPVVAQNVAKPASKPNSTDHDQGDDHASDTAILKVCTHNNPSAQHAAICPHPVSPN
jgi:hypothetical protein